MEDNIAGVILAGGANKRFDGQIKAKVIINGRSIIRRILDTIGIIFSEIIIVTNTPDEFKEFRNYIIVGDHYRNRGPLGGIHAALRASSREACFVFAGDMPLLDSSIIVNQIEYFRNNKSDVFIPRIGQFIEPLHAIYKCKILNHLDEYLVSNHNYAVRDFFTTVDVNYQDLDRSDQVVNAFSNINLPSDILKISKITDAG
jgi:molybdenum cofactor guanylyltransferase